MRMRDLRALVDNLVHLVVNIVVVQLVVHHLLLVVVVSVHGEDLDPCGIRDGATGIR